MNETKTNETNLIYSYCKVQNWSGSTEEYVSEIHIIMKDNAKGNNVT